MSQKHRISFVGAACVFAGLFVCLAGCGGGGGGGSSDDGSSLAQMAYTLTGKVVLPDGSSGPNILVLASRVEQGGVTSKQARVLAVGPRSRRDFLNTLQTMKNESSSTWATVTDAELRQIIRNGRGEMPAFGTVLTIDRIDKIVKHIRSLKQPEAEPKAPEAEPKAKE